VEAVWDTVRCRVAAQVPPQTAPLPERDVHATLSPKLRHTWTQ